ncbi:hypothetical protein BHAOGJBA_1251 [Methylobacterium hispanicum]|uniref:Uncharacterized protein n=1 Tax=Methylobacterium hispanicum TaxID=270350 RepID=A0AAV4ZIS0_9HYPH|nr:hypothetical protein [Methylobacterium hispanicum]GJD87746.1 hypothetical protein BHAOGJBA_1251 [Methylobacterium hispanicum]
MIRDVLNRLRRNRMSATGLSFVEGELVDDPARLPEHLVEIHVFDDANRAQAFVDGLRYASANGVAWTWEPGGEVGNRCVLTARFAEDRPPGGTLSETVPVIEHARNDWDARDRAERDRERRVDQERRREAEMRLMQPLRAAMAEIGLGVAEGAQTWVRCSGSGSTIQLAADGWYEIDCDAHLNRRDGDDPLMLRYVAHAAENGVVFDPEQLELRCARVFAPAEAAAAARLLGEVQADFGPIAKAYWHERFMETMIVTPRIRAFLEGVERGEASIDIVRRNPQIRAGGVVMKRGDISRLAAAGWIDTDHAHFPSAVGITPAGVEAIGPRPDPHETVPPAPFR